MEQIFRINFQVCINTIYILLRVTHLRYNILKWILRYAEQRWLMAALQNHLLQADV